MPRFSYDKATSDMRPTGLGPITEHVMAREEHQQARYGNVNGLRRPDHVLQGLRRGEPVEIPVSLIPRRFHRPGWQNGMRVTITPDM